VLPPRLKTTRPFTSTFSVLPQEPLGVAVVTTKPGETRLFRSAVEVTGDDLVDEASPETVPFLKVLLPQGLDVVKVGLQELVQERCTRLSRSIEKWRRDFWRSDSRLHKRGRRGEVRNAALFPDAFFGFAGGWGCAFSSL
jgi:hypothetical protein